MSRKRYVVKGECPQCACGDVSFLGPDVLAEKYIGSQEEIEVLCPACGTKHAAQVSAEENKA